MSLTVLKQDAEILVEVAKNYERMLEQRKNANKSEIEKYEIYLKNFRSQFLYLLAAIHKRIDKEKNAK